MTTYYLIRHGEPIYQPVDERKFIGHGRDFDSHDGIPPKDQIKVWETAENMKNRMEKVLEKYSKYKKVIVVCHGMVIRTVKYQDKISHGEIIEYVI